jgi:hypothetical protein
MHFDDNDDSSREVKVLSLKGMKARLRFVQSGGPSALLLLSVNQVLNRLSLTYKFRDIFRS